MSRFAPQADMTADEIIECSYDLLAILHVAEIAAMHLHDQHSEVTADSLARVLSLAVELHAPMHDALEAHERAEPTRMTGGDDNG
jgi:hypothetical protein